MIRLIFGVALSLLLATSCSSSSSSLTPAEEEKIRQEVEKMSDSISRDFMHSVFFDTVGVATGPVKVLNVKIYKEEYSSYRNLQFTFMNVSDKKIEAISFRWYGINAFLEPADMGGILQRGFGDGSTDASISPGMKKTVRYGISSRDAKKVIRVWANEVVFSDETKWKSATTK